MPQGKIQTKETIEKAIKDLFEFDVTVDTSDIRVEVDDDTVILSGSVPSYWDRQSAELDALYAPGIRKVVNNLSVCAATKCDTAADEQIRSDIELAFAQSPDLAAADITVAARHGIVTLTGTVNDHWKKLRAAQLTAIETGVVAVNNRLAIVGSEEIDDESIAEQVLLTFEQKGIDVNAIDVEVTEGTVILSGNAPSRHIAEKACLLAKKVPGVTAVENELVVI
jgi:osmotically-inducible protein OsmY